MATTDNTQNTTFQPVNTFTIVARESNRALAEERAERVGGLRSRLVSLEERFKLELRVLALQALTVWSAWRSSFACFFGWNSPPSLIA